MMKQKRAVIFSNLFPRVEEKVGRCASIRQGGGGNTSCLLLNTQTVKVQLGTNILKAYGSVNLH